MISWSESVKRNNLLKISLQLKETRLCLSEEVTTITCSFPKRHLQSNSCFLSTILVHFPYSSAPLSTFGHLPSPPRPLTDLARAERVQDLGTGVHAGSAWRQADSGGALQLRQPHHVVHHRQLAERHPVRTAASYSSHGVTTHGRRHTVGVTTESWRQQVTF